MTLASLKGACQANGESSVSQASTQVHLQQSVVCSPLKRTGLSLFYALPQIHMLSIMSSKADAFVQECLLSLAASRHASALSQLLQV